MTDLSRRHFLTGTVASAAAGTALVLTMPDKALELFKPTVGEIMAVNRPPAERGTFDEGIADYGEFVFNAKGQIIGVIQEVRYHRPAVDVTAFEDSHERTILGPMSYTLIVQGVAQLRGIGRGRA